MVAPYTKNWVCMDCGQQFEKPPSILNPLSGMDTWQPACMKCGSKKVLPKRVSVVRNAVKKLFK